MTYFSETVIFLASGILIGENLLGNHTIAGEHYWKLLIFFVVKILARFIAIGVFYPLLN